MGRPEVRTRDDTAGHEDVTHLDHQRGCTRIIQGYFRRPKQCWIRSNESVQPYWRQKDDEDMMR